MNISIETRSETICFSGRQGFYQHDSEQCDAPMRFSVFLPSIAAEKNVPVLYWLSGLTCTEENFMVKAGAQRYAEALGIALVAPDTSPRGLGLPTEDDDWDFGSGAGFYVDATQEPWSNHYRMYSYVVDELPKIIAAHFPINTQRAAISGHSMGGHGALVIGLRNTQQFQSVSAFSPICAPMQCPWGQKAFSSYLGRDESDWQLYDASYLAVQAAPKIPLLVEQGGADEFLSMQLMPKKLTDACQVSGHPLTFNMRGGYDHSYYFIASFIGDHMAYHAKVLNQS